jgi:hypothetical protein
MLYVGVHDTRPSTPLVFARRPGGCTHHQQISRRGVLVEVTREARAIERKNEPLAREGSAQREELMA